jgi:hypothetical protein
LTDERSFRCECREDARLGKMGYSTLSSASLREKLIDTDKDDVLSALAATCICHLKIFATLGRKIRGFAFIRG